MVMPTTPTPHQAGYRFVQAPVRPVDEDGVIVSILGTLAWVVATAVWGTGSPWLWTGVSGICLGLIGTGFCLWRRRRRQS